MLRNTQLVLRNPFLFWYTQLKEGQQERLVVVMDSFSQAVDRVGRMHGWDVTDWQAYRTEAFRALVKLAFELVRQETSQES